jgi:8-oxo-dGTP diphosphatase
MVPREVSQIDWKSWSPVDRAVLCFVRREGELLLIRKKRGLGAGKINGPGGRIEAGETAEAAAVRETQEEVGLTPGDLTVAGDLAFQFADGYSLSCRVFVARAFSGDLRETDEALPFWCGEDRIPFDEMWADDRLWFPLMLTGTAFSGMFVFDGDAMLSFRLQSERKTEALPWQGSRDAAGQN